VFVCPRDDDVLVPGMRGRARHGIGPLPEDRFPVGSPAYTVEVCRPNDVFKAFRSHEARLPKETRSIVRGLPGEVRELEALVFRDRSPVKYRADTPTTIQNWSSGTVHGLKTNGFATSCSDTKVSLGSNMVLACENAPAFRSSDP
jgi:hypothetical protein